MSSAYILGDFGNTDLAPDGCMKPSCTESATRSLVLLAHGQVVFLGLCRACASHAMKRVSLPLAEGKSRVLCDGSR